ncbi:capsular biosynthesis protein [Listeria weihenstephanensis]|uniref:Capsular biosynthesis protein n=1 Tax=Listeria weihenstephanensis TaxID=1006155 RepID=A0A841Z5X6_9LIST|nr:Wzz/FepE/Etk N-terminal domain-containing protein [Listeria weihenstephanensis]MBC1499783.1 capsular biosynthesis protein [Listeria weihenstephanensis]
MDTLFSMKEILEILRKSWIWIIGFALSGLLIAGLIVTLFITPLYAADTQILVSQTSGTDNAISQNAEVQANLQLVNTYRVLMTSPRILSEVEVKLGKVYTTKDLIEKIKINTEQDSQIITITATDSDPERAARIANETAIAFKKITPKIMKVDDIHILSKASTTLNSEPVSPKPLLIMAIGLFSGALLGIIFAFIRNLLHNTFKEDKDLEILGVPLLGSIGKLPMHEEKSNKKEGVFHEEQTIS